MKNKSSKKIRTILIILVLIVISIFGVKVIGKQSYIRRYKAYTQNIEKLSLDKYYEEGKNSYDYITYDEAIGLMVFAATGEYDLTKQNYISEMSSLNGSSISYIQKEEIDVGRVLTEENIKDEITRKEVIRILGELKEKILNESLDTEGVTLKISKAHKLDEKTLNYLKNFVKTGVVENSGSIDEKNKIRRGEFNRIISKFIEVEQSIGAEYGEVVTDVSNMPSNSIDYPYVLSNNDKTLYELGFTVEDNDAFITPSKLYPSIENGMKITKERIEKYFNLLLNVDYNTIDYDKLSEEYYETMQYRRDFDKLKDYVDYVKEHKIVTKGTATIVMPCVYSTGLNYRIRVKVDFEVLEGDTKENILMGDLVQSAETKNVYDQVNSFTVDAPIEYGITSDDFFTYFFDLKSKIAK